MWSWMLNKIGPVSSEQINCVSVSTRFYTPIQLMHIAASCCKTKLDNRLANKLSWFGLLQSRIRVWLYQRIPVLVSSLKYKKKNLILAQTKITWLVFMFMMLDDFKDHNLLRITPWDSTSPSVTRTRVEMYYAWNVDHNISVRITNAPVLLCLMGTTKHQKRHKKCSSLRCIELAPYTQHRKAELPSFLSATVRSLVSKIEEL